MKNPRSFSATGFSAVFAVAMITASIVAPSSAASDYQLVAKIHAEGAQIYECKADAGGLAWQFKEPVATLFQDGAVVGRHSAGPSWEFDDGSIVVGKVTARAPGATASDIPLLWLEAQSRGAEGRLAGVAIVERINTKGGVANGSCPRLGDRLSVPYSADYTFLR